MEGGAISAEVIRTSLGEHPPAKQPGQPAFEAFKLQLGFSSPDAALHSWIASAWNQDDPRKSGVILTTDINLKVRSRREFLEARITETTFPACDIANREPGYISLAIAPEATRMGKASGKASPDVVGNRQNVWRTSDFNLRIDGLECDRVVRIESFTVKHPPGQAAGSRREYDLEPAGIEFPNLKITLHAESIHSWQDWLDSFVLMGKNGSEDEKKGALELHSADMKEVLATLHFEGLGIFRLEEVGSPNLGAREGIRYTAELYCEKMSFVSGKAKP